MINGKTEIEIMDELRAMDDRKRKPLPVDSPSAGWKSDQEQIKRLEEMVDRAHGALSELLTSHLNINSEGARIAKKGLFAD